VADAAPSGERAASGGEGGSRESGSPLDDLGAFIRERREAAAMSLRRLSDLAGVSDPYLSQIERGLRRPSAQILQAIAKGLEVSAESLYVRAGILEDRPAAHDVEHAIVHDASITRAQRDLLLELYASFRALNAATGAAQAAPDAAALDAAAPDAAAPDARGAG
jgi:transcriptional regulator with XRE-family HTH domain